MAHDDAAIGSVTLDQAIVARIVEVAPTCPIDRDDMTLLTAKPPPMHRRFAVMPADTPQQRLAVTPPPASQPHTVVSALESPPMAHLSTPKLPPTTPPIVFTPPPVSFPPPVPKPHVAADQTDEGMWFKYRCHGTVWKMKGARPWP